MDRISARALKQRIRDGGELALLDLREEGPFSKAHLFHARSMPLSRLELRLADALPRRGVPIIVMDEAGGGRAERGAERLASLGYGDLAILDGGVEGWRAAGYELFSGVNVPSKAFGEVIEQTCGTPHIAAERLKALIDSGRAPVILDSRPFEEFHTMSIPGGIDTPGAELVYRVHDLVPDPEALVVVNCAGRTRSIIGAQSLINAGIPNPVMALENGTMGWQLAGLALEHGCARRAPAPSAAGLAQAKAAAARVTERFGVRRITMEGLEAWRTEADERTLYLLDVRAPEEFEAGHLPGSRSAPGGQLVQASDEYLGVLGARIVLIDDTGVRAAMTASWLVQMGWAEVAVLEGGLDGPLETGPVHVATLGLPAPCEAPVTALELKAILDSGEPAAVLDLATSRAYRRGHIPGAAWGLRGALEALPLAFARVGLVIVTADEPDLARLALPEVEGLLPGAIVRVLEGGNAAWVGAGFALEEGASWMTSDSEDVWYKPYEDDAAARRAMQDYLTWEVGLVEQIARDGDAGFRLGAVATPVA
jgi:rhodanese-related sulfurtransferase